MKKILLGSILTLCLSTAQADNVVNTETNTWKNIPITVDEKNNTYSLHEGYLLPEGNYYYSFSGYRCLKDKNNTSNEQPRVLKSTDVKGTDVYCYKDIQ